MICALQFLFRVRVQVNWDPCHRVGNDMFSAARACGLNKILLLSIILLNLSWGPWMGEAWFQRIREEAANYVKLGGPEDAVFLIMLTRIALEEGQSEARGTQAQAIWDELGYSEFFLRKGQRVLLTRWGSWVHAMLGWVSMWSKRTLILLVYGTQMGYATDHGNRESVTAQKFNKGGPAAAETGDNPTMKQMKEDVKAMYKKAKNTLHLSLLLHLDDELHI